MKYSISLYDDNMQYVWVEDHYDVHLSGTCRYCGELYYFERKGYYNGHYNLYKLNFFEKIKWRWHQWLFEKCVGYHWSYDKDGKRIWCHGVQIRRPEWFFDMLNYLYYLNEKN